MIHKTTVFMICAKVSTHVYARVVYIVGGCIEMIHGFKWCLY